MTTYTPAQVASINAAREANVNNKVDAYSGAGATPNSVAQGNGGTSGAAYVAANYGSNGQPIAASALNSSAQPIQLPAPPQSTNSASVGNLLNSNNSALADNSFMQSLGYASDGKGGFSFTPTTPTDTGSSTTSTDTSGKGMEDIFRSYLGMEQNLTPPNTADMYAKAEADSGVVPLKQEVANYTAQLNSITAKAQADSLSVTGQGRGIPEAIIGGQQAEINKEAAIKALPVQAQLAAAQGNLKLAQDHLDTVFKLQVTDAQNQYEYKNKLVDSVFSFATKQEQTRLDNLKEANDKAYKEKQQNLTLINEWAKTAVQTGQSSLISKFTALDPSSKTFAADFGKLQSQVRDPNVALETQNKQLSNENIRSEIYAREHPKATQGTAAERAAAAVSQFNSAFVPGATHNGIPTLDSDGFATPEAWKAAIKDAPSEGLTRDEFIKEFGHLIYNLGGSVSEKYGITPAEEKLITGALQ